MSLQWRWLSTSMMMTLETFFFARTTYVENFQSRLLFPMFRYLSLPSIPPIFQSPSLSNIRFFFCSCSLVLFCFLLLSFLPLSNIYPSGCSGQGHQPAPGVFVFFSPFLWVDLNKKKKNMGMKLRLPQYRRIHPIYRKKKKKNIQFHLFLFFFSFVSQKLFVVFFFTEKK